MLVKDQIKMRREALDVSLQELGFRTGVTEQAVRHWESGRSYPTKRKARAVEEALGITIDWTEGGARSDHPSTASLIDHADIEMLVTLTKMPPIIKQQFERLVITIFEQLELLKSEGASGLSPKPENSISPFMAFSEIGEITKGADLEHEEKSKQ